MLLQVFSPVFGHASLTLAAIPAEALLWAGGALVAGVVMGLAIGVPILKRQAGGVLAGAKSDAARLTSRAEEDARSTVQRAELDADKRIQERKEKFEKETEAARNEIRETERRIAKREDLLDKKLESLTQKEDQVSKQIETLKQRVADLEARLG